MLVSIFSSELPGNAPGLSRNSFCWLSTSVLRQVDQLAQQPLRGLVGERAAAVRRADRHHAADRRVGLEVERLLQLLLRLRRRP